MRNSNFYKHFFLQIFDVISEWFCSKPKLERQLKKKPFGIVSTLNYNFVFTFLHITNSHHQTIQHLLIKYRNRRKQT